MNENTIRYIVEQKCEKNQNHRVNLGAISVHSTNPRELEQLLILSVDRCVHCSFHSKFYTHEEYTLLEPVGKIKENNNKKLLTLVMTVIILVGFLTTCYIYNVDNDSISSKAFSSFLAMIGAGLSFSIAVLERKASFFTKIASGIAFIVPSILFWLFNK